MWTFPETESESQAIECATRQLQSCRTYKRATLEKEASLATANMVRWE